MIKLHGSIPEECGTGWHRKLQPFFHPKRFLLLRTAVRRFALTTPLGWGHLHIGKFWFFPSPFNPCQGLLSATSAWSCYPRSHWGQTQWFLAPGNAAQRCVAPSLSRHFWAWGGVSTPFFRPPTALFYSSAQGSVDNERWRKHGLSFWSRRGLRSAL